MNTLIVFQVVAVAVAGGALTLSNCERINPVNCELNIAAEACWAKSTGVNQLTGAQILAGETTLTHVVGDQIIEVDGTTISGQWIDGCIAVKANNVTIKNSLIRSDHPCHGGNGQSAAIIDNGNDGTGLQPTGLLIEDTEIMGINVTSDMTGVGTHNLTCNRCNIHGVTKGVYTDSNVIITNSYIHDLTPNAGGAHMDGIFINHSGKVSVEHSYITMKSSTGYVTAAVAIINDDIGDDIIVHGNFLEGGPGYDITGGAYKAKLVPYFTNLRITDNALSPGYGYAYANAFDPSGTGNVWTGNKDSESGALVPAPGIL